jgi:Rrf2 family protein
MIDLAEHDPEQYIPLKEIAQRQEISEKYLEVIVKSLTKAHFLEGLRGKGGGYRLTRDPSSYSVASVLRITEGTLAPIACLQDEVNTCPRAGSCKTLPMWTGLEKVISDYLEGISIQDLANTGNEADNYVI